MSKLDQLIPTPNVILQHNNQIFSVNDIQQLFGLSPTQVQNNDYHFWVTSTQHFPCTHFVADDISDVMGLIVQYVQNQKMLIPQHIQYKNTDQRLLSGITIDMDIYIEADEDDTQMCSISIREMRFIMKFINELVQYIARCSNQQINPDDIQPVYMIRDVIDKTKSREVDSIIYYRCGLHVYIFEYVFTPRFKKYIAQSFIKQLDERMINLFHKIFPASDLHEFFDVNPLQATTSLPLTTTAGKNYTRIYDPQTVQFKHILSEDYINSLYLILNPFWSTTVIDLADNIVVRFNQHITLKEYVQINNYQSYNESIKKIWQSEYIQNLTDSFRLMIQQFNHPPYQHRLQIVQYLYQYLQRQYQNIETIQLKIIFYMMMVENINDILNQNEFIEKPGWYNDSDKSRYPIKIDKFVDDIIIKPSHIVHNPLNKLQQLFNRIAPEGEQIRLAVQSAYDNLIYIKDNINEGSYQDVGLATLASNYKNTFNDILYTYLFTQLEQQYISTLNKMYNYVDEENTNTDFNKYHEIDESMFQKDLCSQLNKLTDSFSYKIKCYKNQLQQMLDTEQYQSIKQDIFGSLTILKSYNINDINVLQLLITIINSYKIMDQIKSQLMSIQRNPIDKLIKGFRTFQFDRRQILIRQGIDQQQNVIGVYNGILVYMKDCNNFKFVKNGMGQYYITQSTLAKIQSVYYDKQTMMLLSPNQLAPQQKEIYQYIDNVYKSIYNKGKDFEVFQWKNYQIFNHILNKIHSADHMLIQYGNGSDGKTTGSQAISNMLGINNQIFQQNEEQYRQVINGYTAQTKSTFLQSQQTSSEKHDTGGLTELQGKFYALLSETSSFKPFVAAQIKSVLCGTVFNTRRAYEKTMTTLINKAFIEYQTNQEPVFDQELDNGLMRRILYYQHQIKFVSQETYNNFKERNNDQNYCVADPTIQERLFSDFDYIDGLLYYCLQQYIQYKHDNQYIPKILLQQSELFFNRTLKYWQQCINLLCHQQNSWIYWNTYTQAIQNFIRSKQQNFEQIANNHIVKLVRYFVQKSLLCAYNKINKQTQIVVENDYNTLMSSAQYILFLKEYQFVDATLQTTSQRDYNIALKEIIQQ